MIIMAKFRWNLRNPAKNKDIKISHLDVCKWQYFAEISEILLKLMKVHVQSFTTKKYFRNMRKAMIYYRRAWRRCNLPLIWAITGGCIIVVFTSIASYGGEHIQKKCISVSYWYISTYELQLWSIIVFRIWIFVSLRYIACPFAVTWMGLTMLNFQLFVEPHCWVPATRVSLA